MPSFDIVCKTDLQEVDNAINSANREIGQRYDFKGSNVSLERKDNEITLLADDDYKLKAAQDIIKVHMTKRNIDPKSLIFQKEEQASGNMLRQKIEVQQGIDSETAKKIVKSIKSEKIKVQAAIRGDEIRISGKKRDDLQNVIQHIKSLKDVEHPLQFINMRD